MDDVTSTPFAQHSEPASDSQPSERRHRAIFLDIDGTLVDHGYPVSPRVTEAIRSARARGHKAFICTGRSLKDVQPEVLRIGFDGAITNGGAGAVVGDETVFSLPMPREDAQRVIEYFTDLDLGVMVQTDHQTYTNQKAVELTVQHDQAVMAIRDAELRAQGIDPATVDAGESFAQWVRHFPGLDELDLDTVRKVVFVSGEQHDLGDIQADLGDRLLVIPGSLPLGAGSSAEVCAAGVTKGFAIGKVAEYLGIDMADTVGIGDSWNDHDMFLVTGDSFAMANADPELKKFAKHQTASVSDDGVAEALEYLDLV